MDWNISAEEFLTIYEKYGTDIIVLDVREEHEFKCYRLPSSILLPMDELYCRVKELNQAWPIYIICEHGIRSIHATMILYDLGFNQVYNVMGGFEKIMNYKGLIT
ncbi:rhodanese-like domain-containing protein [Desulfuribacillus alkaliarsenatis]|uniref:Rhodanese domain-containing protein n=1 Tax=Desulfuribacillus alkaliarsenatis TaxID=766136 RepID=A0A1E5G630_9FIRM|nr:rhodanese-like domain-containing protein [Desulfuribacillus alkaliarsenatis]OEF98224.1 hypothetical protein BHF68_00615 [Desulfuribacillus alkaliarsenatis]